MMSVHDALEAWQAGEITAGQAMRLTSAADIMELYAFAHSCGVEVRSALLSREEDQVTGATALIRQAMLRDAVEPAYVGEPMAAK